MSPLDALAPDQRAVVVAACCGRDGRYDDVAAMLGIPVAAVRSRAHAGLAALAPGNGLPAEITAPLADYLLGQQSEADAAATRGLHRRVGPGAGVGRGRRPRPSPRPRPRAAAGDPGRAPRRPHRRKPRPRPTLRRPPMRTPPLGDGSGAGRVARCARR